MATEFLRHTQLWTDKYFPKTLEEFIGNSDIVEKANDWATQFDLGNPKKPLLLHGMTGAGKTCLALLIAKLHDWDVFELNASDLRDKETIERLVSNAGNSATFSGKPRLVLLDEVDGLQGRSDRGAHAAIGKILKDSQNPIILTANDIWGEPKLRDMIFYCEKLEFKKINYLSIAKRLRGICAAERIEANDEALKEIAQLSNGDFRSVLLDVQCLAMDGRKVGLTEINDLGVRERQDNVFNVLKKIFKGKTVKEIQEARLTTELDHGMLKNWMEENLPRELQGPEIAQGFDWLSRADIFDGRIYRRQHWGFLRYASELMTSGVALSKTPGRKEGWVMHQFPGILKKMKANMGERATRKNAAKKIAEQTHTGIKSAISDDMVFVKEMMKNKEWAPSLTAYYEFDENDLAYLLETKKDTKKVVNLLEQAKELSQKKLVKKRGIWQGLQEEDLPAADEPEIEEAVKEPDQALELGKGQTKLFG